jgi:hypothetical protein
MADAPSVDSASTTPAVEEAAPAFLDLYAGNELSSEDANAVTLRSPTHLVVFAGAAESGKTTVLASVYEQLNDGPFAGFQFAGSRSLLGFEQICHLNRLASRGTRPDTPRTVPADEAAYYHLALRRAEPGAPRRHVLLSAISGELFRLAKNSREDCERLTFLHRANTVVVLVDGARLAVTAQRTNAQSEASSILESFLDAKMLGSRCRVEFVFSKLDRIVEAGDAAVEFLNATETKLKMKFGDRVPHLAFRRIAARPEVEPSGAPLDDGLAEAFTAWTTPVHVVAGETPQVDPPSDAREFAKYGWRYAARKES